MHVEEQMHYDCGLEFGAVRWRRDGELVVDGETPWGSHVEGAGTRSLMIRGCSLQDAGTYHCETEVTVNTVIGPAQFVADLGAMDFVEVCTSDFNCDGGIDGSDVAVFFGVWESGDFASDINKDGGVDGSDVSVFFERWERGC